MSEYPEYAILRTLHDGLTPELLHPIEVRASTLRAYYGRQGKIVYDRLDRWNEEHGRCAPGSHESGAEGCMYVVHCRERDAVAVCESWQFTVERS